MNPGLAIALASLGWAAFGIGSGWCASRIPLAWLGRDRWLTHLFAWEARGRVYDRRLRVRVWKDRLPEAGALFSGGWAKDRLRSFDVDDLERLAAETRRAEWVHWAQIGFGASFALWSDSGVWVAMVAFGAVVHLPFVIVQRYNRARLAHVIPIERRRATRRADRARAAGTGVHE